MIAQFVHCVDLEGALPSVQEQGFLTAMSMPR